MLMAPAPRLSAGPYERVVGRINTLLLVARRYCAGTVPYGTYVRVRVGYCNKNWPAYTMRRIIYTNTNAKLTRLPAGLRV